MCLRSLHYVILRGRKIGTTKNNVWCIFSTAKRENLKPGKGHGLKNTDLLWKQVLFRLDVKVEGFFFLKCVEQSREAPQKPLHIQTYVCVAKCYVCVAT